MDTSDILIHVHPELSAEGRAKIENEVMRCASAAISGHHASTCLNGGCNPDAITGKQILAAMQ